MFVFSFQELAATVLQHSTVVPRPKGNWNKMCWCTFPLMLSSFWLNLKIVQFSEIFSRPARDCLGGRSTVPLQNANCFVDFPASFIDFLWNVLHSRLAVITANLCYKFASFPQRHYPLVKWVSSKYLRKKEEIRPFKHLTFLKCHLWGHRCKMKPWILQVLVTLHFNC